MSNPEERLAVIGNIRDALERKDYHAKVEPGDPKLSEADERKITTTYLKTGNTYLFRAKKAIATLAADTASALINRDTEIVGAELLPKLNGGAIITSNHFSPTENTAVRHLVKKCLNKRLCIVSQVSNFAMTGAVGFLMNYANTIPLSGDTHYLTHGFLRVISRRLKKEVVLIYPEQEMWFNYRKPRPPKPGAYYFAAKTRVPVISCFTEIVDLPEKENESFYKTKFRIHVLGVLTPDPEDTVSNNTKKLCRADFELKKAAYERIYNKPLTYDFSPDDIAGWIPNENNTAV
ncbi:MAG: lysophospholipid acyltransferase family protein [Eubacteriales bacterium]